MTEARMRVLHVIPTVALEHGGPANVVRAMATAVREHGVEVEVVSTDRTFGYEGLRDPGRIRTFDEDGTTFRIFPQIQGISISLTRWLFEHVSQYDLLHIHYPFAYSTSAACIAARTRHIPYVYRTIGALDPWCFRQKAWKKQPYYRLFVQRELRAASAIHVTSRAEYQALADLGFASQAKVVPLGVKIPPLMRPHTPSSEGSRFLFVGRLEPIKGLPLLFEAMRILAQRGTKLELRIAGIGTPAYRRQLEQLVRAAGLSDNIHFLGFVRGEAKAKLFAESDVFVLPGYHESFGVAAVEAMAYGLPAIVCDGVALATEIVAARAGESARSGDVSSLVRALEHALDPAWCAATGKRARAFVQTTFTVDAMGRALVALYHGAVGNARAVPSAQDGPLTGTAHAEHSPTPRES